MMQNAARDTAYLIRPNLTEPMWTLCDSEGPLYTREHVQELLDMVWAGVVRPRGRTTIEILPTREAK